MLMSQVRLGEYPSRVDGDLINFTKIRQHGDVIIKQVYIREHAASFFSSGLDLITGSFPFLTHPDWGWS